MTTVVICAYTAARWSQLERAVASAEVQSPCSEVVLVIDHNDALLGRAQQRWSQHVVIPNSRTRGLSGARNSGVAAAHGEIIAFLDDDAFADSSWLAFLIEPFRDPAIGGTGGFVVPDFAQPPPRWFPEEYWWVVGCTYRGHPVEARRIRNPIGANMAFRRVVLNDVGGFREGIGRVGSIPLGCEETELAIRAGSAGYGVWYEPKAVVHHYVPAARLAPRYFVRRCYAEGVSKAAVASIAGAQPTLSSESTYLTKVLSKGVLGALRDVCRGPHRVSAAGRAAALLAGAGAAAAGFAAGSLPWRRVVPSASAQLR